MNLPDTDGVPADLSTTTVSWRIPSMGKKRKKEKSLYWWICQQWRRHNLVTESNVPGKDNISGMNWNRESNN